MPLRPHHPPTDQSFYWLGFIILLLGLGIFFRFANLDQIYWHDEAYTSLRLSGFTSAQLNQDLFNGQIKTIAEVMKYQWPTSGSSPFSTIQALAIDDAQHPPLYYILAWFWVKTFGSSVIALRSLSVVISLFGFPAIYWVCYELLSLHQSGKTDGSKKIVSSVGVGSLAMAFLALSPFQILYAQEAREYALWTILLLGLNAIFLRALRLSKRSHWLSYGAFFTLGLYTFPLTGLVGLGHGFYALLIYRQRFQAWLITAVCSLGLFLPWLYLIMTTWNQTGATWTARPIPLSDLIQAWAVNLGRCFMFLPPELETQPLILLILSGSLCTLLILSIWKFIITNPLRVWFLPVVSIAVTTLPFFLADLLLGGQRSISSRYLIPAILWMEIFLAYFFTAQLTVASQRLRQIYVGCLFSLLGLGIYSGIQITTAQTSWIKFLSYSFPQVFEIINSADDPLIIGASGNINTGTILALGQGVQPQARFVLIDHWYPEQFPVLPTIPRTRTSIFVLNLSEDVRTGLEAKNGLSGSLIFSDQFLKLWQLQPHSGTQK